MISITHGRPAMISDQLASSVPLPQIPASPLGSTKGHLQGPVYRHAFFIKSLELYEIINHAILAFYSSTFGRHDSVSDKADPSQPSQQSVELGSAIRLDDSLTRWEHSLPAYLRSDAIDNTVDEVCRRQAIILRIRYVSCHIWDSITRLSSV
jgi:hypothetical protein